MLKTLFAVAMIACAGSSFAGEPASTSDETTAPAAEQQAQQENAEANKEAAK